MSKKHYYNLLLEKQMTRKEFLLFCGILIVSLIPIYEVISRLFETHAETPADAKKTNTGINAGPIKKITNGSEASSTPLYLEQFDTFDLITPSNPNGQWYANPDFPSSYDGIKDPAGATWDANPNQAFPGIGTLNPFKLGPITDSSGSSSDGNAITITCQKSTSAIKSAIGYAAWGGTFIQNADVKYFRVGSYIEVRALFNGSAPNMWPAIWFFAAQGKNSGNINSQAFGGAEVDLVEPQGNINKGWTTMYMYQQGDTPNPNYQVDGNSYVGRYSFYGYPIQENTWATYGFDWQTNGLTYYLNGVEVASETNPVVLSFFNNAKMAFRLDYTLGNDSLDGGPLSVSVDSIKEWQSFAASRS